jgi:hypothetical protein
LAPTSKNTKKNEKYIGRKPIIYIYIYILVRIWNKWLGLLADWAKPELLASILLVSAM